jgi:hypothetical protein
MSGLILMRVGKSEECEEWELAQLFSADWADAQLLSADWADAQLLSAR